MTKRWLWLCLLTACTSSGADSTGITASSLTCPPDSTLTYASFGQDFITANCLSCHGSKASPRLDTQAEIQAARARILDQAVFTTAMPQDTDIDIAERQLLGEWLTCGAP
ncbi:MAG TPA: hypothetical protein VFQ53_04345 [Kofleriaceae bacterium]|nr:hypothetical protein [Kofleriaceae bacterium]